MAIIKILGIVIVIAVIWLEWELIHSLRSKLNTLERMVIDHIAEYKDNRDNDYVLAKALEKIAELDK